MKTLQFGSLGEDVANLQKKLNDFLQLHPKLVEDGQYDHKVAKMVTWYQQLNWIADEPGVAGPRTLNALYKREAYPPILHKIALVPQPNKVTCWAASTAMLTGSSVAAVISRTPKDMVYDSGTIKMYPGPNQDVNKENRRFAQAHFLHALPARMSWSLAKFKAELEQGPIMFGMLWDVNSYLGNLGSPGHLLVVAGMRGDDDPSGEGTTIRVYNPWPPTRGEISSFVFSKWMESVPLRTYEAFRPLKVPGIAEMVKKAL